MSKFRHLLFYYVLNIILWLSLPFLYLGVCHNPIFTPGIFLNIDTQNETARTKPVWSEEGSPRQITSKWGLGHISWNPTKFSQAWPGLTKVDRDLTEVWPSRFRPDWGPIYLETLKTGSGIHFPESWELWPSLTKFDWGWPRIDWGLTKLFLTCLGSTMPKNPQNVVRDTFPRIRRALTKFDQVWPSLTEVWPDCWPDRKLNWTDHPLTNAWSTLRASIRYFMGKKRTRNEGVIYKIMKKRSNT